MAVNKLCITNRRFLAAAGKLELSIYCKYVILRSMVNRMRATRAHRDNRRSHHALGKARLSKCQNCGVLHKSHTICMNCGWYNGRKVIDLAAKAAAKAKKVSETKKV